MRITFLFFANPLIAAMHAPTLVAFESLTQRMPCCFATNWQRCGKPRYSLIDYSIAVIGRAIAWPKAKAAKALPILCWPVICNCSMSISFRWPCAK